MGVDDLEAWVLKRAQKRRWERVDQVICWAFCDATSPQEAHAIDLAGRALTVSDLRVREVTVRSTGQAGAMGPNFAELAADRARIRGIVDHLDHDGPYHDVMPLIVKAAAFGFRYDEIDEGMRSRRGAWNKNLTPILVREGRERVARLLVELGHLPAGADRRALEETTAAEVSSDSEVREPSRTPRDDARRIHVFRRVSEETE